jgi:hypothetical protein
VEQIADVLSEDETTISDEERATMHSLNHDMDMGDRVPNALLLCPRLG